jgi:hypothetical protein
MRTMRMIALGATLASGGVGVGCSDPSPGMPVGPDTLTTADTMTVNGKVVDGALQPLAGLPVLVTGHAPVTTDANGQFSVSGVEKPYDVATALSDLRFVVVYTKLTRDDPVIRVSVTSLVTPQTQYGNVSGTVSGGAGYPETPYHRTQVLFESPEATYSTGADRYNGGYRMVQIDWRGSRTTSGTIHALQLRLDSTTHLPAEYLGYGTRTGVVVSDGGDVTGQDVQMTPVAAMTISGTVTVPNGYLISSRNLLAGFGPAPTAPPVWNVLSDSRTTSGFRYVAPNLPGAGLTLRVTARPTARFAPSATAARTVTDANASVLSITVPPAPELVAPEDSAAGVTVGATLAWHGMSGAVYLVTILEEGRSNPTRFNIMTADTTAVIPDLSALGFPLGAATSYGWAVYGIGPFASLDDAAGSTSFFVPGDWSSGWSGDRHFTTAP